MNVEVYTKGRLNNYEAYGIFDGKGLVVKKGSKVSEKVAKKCKSYCNKAEGKSITRRFYYQRGCSI